jgi:ATP-binding cassette subfamily C protein CydCD
MIIVMRAGFIWAGEISSGTAASKIKQGIRRQILTHIQSLGPAYLRGQAGESGVQTGEVVNLASEGVDALEVYFSQYLPQIALAALIPLTILIFVFPTDALSGMVLLITGPLIPIFMYLIGSAAEALTRKQWLGLSRMSAYFLDVLQGLTTLKTLGRSRDQIEVIKKVSEHYRQTTMGVLRVTFLSALVLEMVATLGTAVVAVEIGIRLLYGKLAFEQAFFILLLAPEFYLPLRLLGTRFHAGMAGVEAANRIYGILDLPIMRDGQPPVIYEGSKTWINHPPHIIFKNVGFSYSNNHPALDNVSIEIPPAKMTALVGPSGAGKTTLTWLLLRFLRPQNGEIIVDGKSIDEFPIRVWQENIAWVPQNPYLFDDTIAANIKLPKPDANQSEIVEAARLAHADEFIQELPLGYDTRIGERGVRLSAGQSQRIALARAFLKDAPLLILDEATSHLDPETDAQLRNSFQLLIKNRTVVVIAHHRATVAMADQVVKLNRGKVSDFDDPLSPPVDSEMSDKLPVTISDEHPHQTSSLVDPQFNALRPSAKQSSFVRMVNLLIPFWGRIALSIVLGFATIASGIGLMATAAYIISAAALHPSIAELQVAIVGVRFFGISRGVFRYLERLVSHDVTFRLLARWRAWFYQALEPLAPARLLRYHTGDLLSRVIRDIGSLENFYIRTLNPPLVALLISAAVLLFLASFGAPLAWGLLVFLFLAGIGLPVLITLPSRRLGPSIINARAQLGAILVDSIQGMPDILTCGQSRSTLERVDAAGTHLAKLQNRMSGITSLQTAGGSLLANLGMLSVLVIAIKMVSNGQLEGVLLGAMSLAAFTCFEAMQPLPQVAQIFETNKAAAGRLYELVDATPPVIDQAAFLSRPESYDLVVQNLGFQYPPWSDSGIASPSSAFRLKNISFSLPQGKHIALIGQSGAGKTTLVNLLLRFWEYQQGSILIGGHELQSYRQDDIRRQIAVISQNTYLFSATIKENLLIAKPTATENELIQVIKQAQLNDLIQSLPDGYDTWIGEHGLYLSAGERQRLAVARVLLKGSPLLILDEPTANLDPITALDVLKAIQGLSLGRSTITITQDMVGLESMDEILVLQKGSIIERGTHAQLLSYRGTYHRMWDIYHQIV